MWKKEVALVIVFLMLISSAFGVIGSVPVDSTIPVVSTTPINRTLSNYISHLPIRINSNAEFASMAAVEGWAGDGTSGNPYIIQGYDINGTGYGYGIYIGNTTDYFIVRNNYLHDANGFPGVKYYDDSGLYLYYVANGRIDNNNASGNSNFGLRLDESDNNTIADNNVNLNKLNGIRLYKNSNNNVITNNSINSNDWDGIYLWLSDSNTINNNSAWYNYRGIYIASSSYNIINNNNASLNTHEGIDLVGSNNTIINNIASNNDIGIEINPANNNNIISNNISNNRQGIRLYDSWNNTISNNIFSNNKGSFGAGIFSDNGVDNNITNNTFSNNNFGIYFQVSTNNIIYHNNFIGNTNHALNPPWYNNSWDNGYPSGGNYWSDWTSPDTLSGPNQDQAGSDGFVDNPYNITGGMNQDKYPFTSPNGWVSFDPYPIYGYVKYTNGDKIEGVNVTVTNVATGDFFSQITNALGQYSIDLTVLPSGYTNGDPIEVSTPAPHQGFNSTVVNTAWPGEQVDIIVQEEEPDTTSPTVISTTPSNSEENVNANSNIVVLFSEPMNQTSVENAFYISPNVSGTFSWNPTGDEMTYAPSMPLEELTGYLVSVGFTAKDLSGNNMVSNHTWTFTTGEKPRPDLSITPSDISFSNSNPSQWEEITISATIHNDGGLEDTTNWPMFGHDASRSGFTNSQGPTSNQTLWLNSFTPIYNRGTSSPTVSDDMVYVSTADSSGGKLIGMNKSDGNIIWELGTPGNNVYLSQPIVIDDNIYLNQRTQSAADWQNRWTDTVSIDKNTQQTIWSSRIMYTTNTNGVPEITYDDGSIYTASNIIMNSNYSIDYVAIRRLDATNGNVIWINNFTIDRYQSDHPPISVGENIIVFTGYNGVYGLDKQNGNLIWNFNTLTLSSTVATISNGRVYFGVRDHIYSLYENNGTMTWDKYLGPSIYPTSLSINNENIFVALSNFASRETNVIAIDALTGNSIWTSATYPEDYVDTPVISNGMVYVGFVWYLRAFDENTGIELWQTDLLDLGVTIYPHHEGPAISEGVLYITNARANLYAIGAPSSIPQEPLVNATATVSFYLDSINPDNLIYREYEVFVPGGGSTVVSTGWVVDVTGNHTIIVNITDSDPLESDLSNNQASKALSITPPQGKLKVKASSDKQKYVPGVDSQAEVIVKVTYQGGLIDNASVTAWVIDPNEMSIPVSMSEFTPGIYKGTYLFSNASAAGTYRIKAFANKTGYQIGENKDSKDKFFYGQPTSLAIVNSLDFSSSIIDVNDTVTISTSIDNYALVSDIHAVLNKHGGRTRLAFPLYDDGQHSDGLAGDGIFANTHVAEIEGTFSADVYINGMLFQSLDAVIVGSDDMIQIETFDGLYAKTGRLLIDSPTTNTTIQVDVVADIYDVSFIIIEHRTLADGKSVEIIPSDNVNTAMIRAHIEIGYTAADIPAGEDESQMLIYLYNPFTGESEPLLPGGVDINGGTVEGDTEHFSDFMVLFKFLIADTGQIGDPEIPPYIVDNSTLIPPVDEIPPIVGRRKMVK